MALTPAAVTLQDLLTLGSDVNLMNDGIKTQEVSPRENPLDVVTVQVTDDPVAPSVSSGTADTDTLNTLEDSAATFATDGVEAGYSAINTADGSSALITVVTETALTLGTSDIFPAGTETYRVVAPSYWVQKRFTGEWIRSASRLVDKIVAYLLPTAGTASTVNVHTVVYPVTAPEDTGNYPPTGWKA